MISVRYKRMKLADLVPDPENPRTITKRAKQALSASVRRFGLVQPIIVNETTGHVVGGHQRLEVLREQGVTEIDVAIGAWSIDDERALNVALNNPAAQGEFGDVRAYLSNALRGLSLDDFHALRFDELVLGPKENEGKRKNAKALEYKLVVTCTDEEQQAQLLDEFEAKGLVVKVLIV